MRALIVQHEPNGHGGRIEAHLRERGAQVHVMRVMAPGSTESNEPFPDPTDYDVIVPLGSIHGVYDDDVIGSWVHREIHMLRAAHEAEVPIFGICFGAQAVATALGGRVERSPQWEIGWYHYEVHGPDSLPAGPWFTWHGDRCVLPENIKPFASTDLCPQAFRVGRTVGVQFHPEVTRELVADWVAKCPPGYFDAHGVSAGDLLAGFDDHGPVVDAQSTALFDWFLDEVAVS